MGPGEGRVGPSQLPLLAESGYPREELGPTLSEPLARLSVRAEKVVAGRGGTHGKVCESRGLG